MQFKLVGGTYREGEREAQQRAFAAEFFHSPAHLDLLGRVYGKLIVAVDDLDVPMRRIVEDERERLRNSYSYRMLCESDRDCIEWVLDRAETGEAPGRPRPEMVSPIELIARVCEAISSLCDAIADAAPGWRWRFIDAIYAQLDSETAYHRLDGEGQCGLAPFLDETDLEERRVQVVERERGR